MLRKSDQSGIENLSAFKDYLHPVARKSDQSGIENVITDAGKWSKISEKIRPKWD